MPLSGFHPIVQRWFLERFEAATPAQERGWPAIAQGHHTLIAAPTGSGKTLAAFLTCIDRLVRAGLEGRLPDRTEVVYVSPLRALANDVERNLTEPLAEIRELAEAVGTPLPEIRVAVRTGDTPQRDRQAMTRRPPHILITTPESLYILLTSESGRRGLRGARTLIVDEVHAIVGNKRGSHLSLSMERLRALADGPVTRIGLSATQRPIEEVARFLVGADDDEADGSEDPRGDAAAPCGDAPLADAAESLRGGAPPCCRATLEGWGRAGVRGHGLAGAWDRHRRGGPGVPDRIAPVHRPAPAAGRPLGPLPRRHSQGPPFSAHPRRADGVHRAPPGGVEREP